MILSKHMEEKSRWNQMKKTEPCFVFRCRPKLLLSIMGKKMKRKFPISAIIFLQASFFYCGAQNTDLKFNLVEGPNGKRLGNITAITEDPYGYMWFSGQSAQCLYRYDGNRM